MSELSPLERVEHCHAELLVHYADAEDAELRAAAKLLLVALDKFRRHGGPHWHQRVEEYLLMARDNPQKLDAVLAGNRSVKPM